MNFSKELSQITYHTLLCKRIELKVNTAEIFMRKQEVLVSRSSLQVLRHLLSEVYYESKIQAQCL